MAKPNDNKKMTKEQARRQKALKKQQKTLASDMEEQETTGGKILIAGVSVAIVLVWLAIFVLLVKWDVGGFGSSVLYPILKDVPYINKILPEVKEENDPYAFDSINQAVDRIKELELQLSEYQKNTNERDEIILALQEEIAKLKIYEEQQLEFEKIKEKFNQEVVFGDNAPDIEEYKEFYEAIDPEGAAALYKQVVGQMQKDEELENYVKAYSTMKPQEAADIMEKMTDNLELVAKILENMNAEARGAILAAMDETIAANLTKLMEP